MRYLMTYLVVRHFFANFVAKYAAFYVVLCRISINKPFMYIHERDNWTNFRWDASEVSNLQEIVCRKQGQLYGRLSSLGFDSKLRAMAENLTHDVVYSSEIEGIRLNEEQVRSSIARKLGIENVKYTAQ